MSEAAVTPGARPEAKAKALSGFLLSGFILAFVGAVLPAWGYHRDPPDFVAVGNYFLSVALGVMASSWLAKAILKRRGLSFLLVFGCALSCLALAYLSFVSPPLSAWWRVAGLFLLGIGAGLLNLALFHVISPLYLGDPARTVVTGGVWYGLGCLSATLLVAETLYSYTVPSILLLMAAVPGVFAAMYAGNPSEAAPPGANPTTFRQALEDFRSPGAWLFAALLFVQFGNEWSIAGWLPLFLIRRVGLSPGAALGVLALYWACLMAGRLLVIGILPRVRHSRLLMGSGLAALFGCLILFSTDNLFGAGTGAFFLGAGYASIYPLVAEAIGRRFPRYHPAFFNGIFSLALVGAMLAPATLGYGARWLGVGVVMAIPLLGTCLVVLLLMLIWLESKVTGR